MHSPSAPLPRADPSAQSRLAAAGFTRAQCDALFEAILIDDVVDAATRLPDRIVFDYPADTLRSCFVLCRALWRDGFDRSMLIGMSTQLIRGKPLDDSQRRQFKAVRAKFKHFRYAYRLYGVEHRVPSLLDRVTIVMGKLQDAIRNRHRLASIGHALSLRLLLLAPYVRRLEREAHDVAMSGAASFRAMFEEDAARLSTLAGQPMISGRELHAGRKIIGRHVSFYDTLRTLAPSSDAYAMSRSLSAINGLMGELHDRLVERKLVDPRSYDQESLRDARRHHAAPGGPGRRL